MNEVCVVQDLRAKNLAGPSDGKYDMMMSPNILRWSDGSNKGTVHPTPDSGWTRDESMSLEISMYAVNYRCYVKLSVEFEYRKYHALMAASTLEKLHLC